MYLFLRAYLRHFILYWKNRWAIYTSSYFANRNLGNSPVFSNRFLLWEFVFANCSSLKKSDGLLVEFGVWEGESVNYFSTLRPKWSIFGLDSFFGLEEEWSANNWDKGALSLNGQMPQVGPNVTLINGWFKDTMPDLKNAMSGTKIDFLHIDVDTYTPATLILKSLGINYLSVGSIIVFDQFFGYPGWKRHEFKAWKEFLGYSKRGFTYIASAPHQVAIRIDS
jgi:hypothetical protein